ncbi:glycine betaine ABC transporter substrate-binding protein, partial [Streptococcus pyogenes]
MDGTSLGLAVPAYMNIKSIAELNNQAQRQIIGIEPGAGIMARTEEALDSYSNLSNWTLTTSSTGTMITSLEQALRNREE